MLYTIMLDSVLSLDLRHKTPEEATATIAVGAAGFAAAEVLCHLLLRGLVRQCMFPKGVPPGPKAQQEADTTVTQVIVRIVSILHILIQIPVAFLVLGDQRLAGDPIYATSPLSCFMVLCSSSYFAYDLLQVLYRFKQEGPSMLVHAICCLFVYSYAVYSLYLHYFGAAFLLWELSTPLVHLRWVLSQAGAGSTRLYLANGLAMVVVFFACRPAWGTYMSYRFFVVTQEELAHPRPGGFSPSGIWAYRVANVALNALNYLWFYKMASKAVRLLAAPKAAGSSSSSSSSSRRQKAA